MVQPLEPARSAQSFAACTDTDVFDMDAFKEANKAPTAEECNNFGANYTVLLFITKRAA